MTDRSYLREFEQLALLSVLRLGDEAHGASIRLDLEQTAGRAVSVATIYVALSRMEQRGLVRSWMSAPTPVRGGKAKKHYALEAAGRDALRQSKATLERMWQGVGAALEDSPRDTIIVMLGDLSLVPRFSRQIDRFVGNGQAADALSKFKGD